MSTNQLTRRVFLKGTALGSAGLVLAACAPTAPAVPAAPAQAPAAVGNEKEAPMLRQLVAEGKLPPLEERLPKDPVVLTPFDKVGQYSDGQMVQLNVGPVLDAYEYQFLYEAPYRWSADASKIEPNLAIKHEYAADGMSMTLSFRDGVKWSDGEPFYFGGYRLLVERPGVDR